MDTQDLIKIKKQRIQEELEKLVPPGFTLQPHPKNRTRIYDELDKFLGIDESLAREVGYLVATNKQYDLAIQNLRFFGVKLRDYKEVKDTGPFHKDAELNRNLEESCDYTIRFYDLAEITIKRINDEEDVRLKLLQNQQEKEKKALEQSEAEEKKQKAKSFVSGATSFRPGTSVRLKVTKLPGIIPKRTAPQEVLEKISKPQLQAEETEEGIGGSKRIVSALGRLALSLEQTNDNLEGALAKIAEDIANTREQNRKEVEEYRKRVTNRGRTIGKRELGSSKVDVSGLVKKYVGGFFSGAGGAIRALALFNMLEAFMNGKPLDALGPLLGIGATYLPAIGGMIAGMIGKKVLGGLLGAARGGTAAARGGVTAARGAGAVAGMPKLGKFAAIAAAGAGALALGSSMLGGKDETENAPAESAIQKRLDELETQQKDSGKPQVLGAIPDSILKRFESLNEKFERALDILLKKQKEVPQQESRGGGGGGGGGHRPGPGLPPGGEIPQELLDANIPENMAGYLTRLSYLETRLRNIPNAQGSGAEGYFQAKDEFAQEAKESSGGLDPRSADFTEASKAVMSWIYKYKKSAYDAIMQGDYNKADKILGSDSLTWPVFRGQSQAQPESVQKEADKFLKNKKSPQPTPQPTPEPQSPVSLIKPRSADVAKVPSSTSSMLALNLPQNNQQSTPMSMADNGGNPVHSVSTVFDNNVYRDNAISDFQVVRT